MNLTPSSSSDGVIIDLVFIIIFLAIYVFVVAGIFSRPAHMSVVRQRAINDNRWRWGLIGGLAILPLLIQTFGLMLITPNIQSLIASMYGGSYVIERDERNALIDELRWRTFIFWEDERCFSDDAEVCSQADEVLQEVNRFGGNSLSGFYFVSLISSIATGFWVHRITRDIRKAKRE